MKITGHCHCGAIEYEAELDPQKVGICHCSDCQQLSASDYRTVAIVDAAQFQITKGTPKDYLKVADSGNRRHQGFCSDCGSGLYSVDPDASAVYNIRVGTIDQRAQLRPRFEIWRASALPWLPGLDGTEKYDFQFR